VSKKSRRLRITRFHSRRRHVGDLGHGDVVAVRWPQIPGPVRAMLVVMADVLIQDRAQVPWPGDQQPPE
jgi:hypothetical protein